MGILISKEKALIFRIVHRDNLRWIAENGMHCRNSKKLDPNYRRIGNPDLIEKRQGRTVPIPPGGTLGDYVPFYFTPFSPMLYNIKTGYNGVEQHSNDDIIIFVSSVPRVAELGLVYVFTDRHAYLSIANFYSELTHLDKIDWQPLLARDFRSDVEDPGKIERYQAEAMVYRQVPVSALLGVACHSEAVKTELQQHIEPEQLLINVRNDWYF